MILGRLNLRILGRLAVLLVPIFPFRLSFPFLVFTIVFLLLHLLVPIVLMLLAPLSVFLYLIQPGTRLPIMQLGTLGLLALLILR